MDEAYRMWSEIEKESGSQLYMYVIVLFIIFTGITRTDKLSFLLCTEKPVLVCGSTKIKWRTCIVMANKLLQPWMISFRVLQVLNATIHPYNV